MKRKNLTRRVLLALSLGMSSCLPLASALPQGMDATTATQVTAGTTMNVTGTAANNLIRWQAFSIAKGETVNFDGKNYLNLVKGTEASQIFGALNNPGGKLYLINPNGILFGSTAQVHVGSLVASTRSLDSVDSAGFTKSGADPLATPVNYTRGTITNLGTIAADSLVLEGQRIVLQNTASIQTADGKQALNNHTGSVVLRSGGQSASKLIAANKANVKTVNDEYGIPIEQPTDQQVYENEVIFADPLFDNTGYIDIGFAPSAQAATAVDSTTYSGLPTQTVDYTTVKLDGKTTKAITPYWLVRNAYELQEMHNNTAGNYMLTTTVDLKGMTWQPLAQFSGNFNGLGHGILNLTVQGTKDADTGFVGDLSGSVRDVDFVNAQVKGSGTAKTGIVAGNVSLVNYGAQRGTIAGVTVSGQVQGDAAGSTDVGGIAGVNTGGILHDVVNTATVKDGSHTAGGIVGINEGNGLIVRAANKTSINTAATSGVGGIAGMNFGTIRYGYNTGDIYNSSMTPIPAGEQGDRVGSFAGGIAGRNGMPQYSAKTSTGEVCDSVNTGNVDAAISVFYGSIAGRGDMGHNTPSVNNYVYNTKTGYLETKELQPEVTDADVKATMQTLVSTATTRLQQQKVETPVTPGTDTPSQPGGDTPTKPGGDTPVNPGSSDTPTTPGATPVNPGSSDTPATPGSDTPSTPGGKDQPAQPTVVIPEPMQQVMAAEQQAQAAISAVQTNVTVMPVMPQAALVPASTAQAPLPQVDNQLTYADAAAQSVPAVNTAPTVQGKIILRPQAAQPVTIEPTVAAATSVVAAPVTTANAAPQPTVRRGQTIHISASGQHQQVTVEAGDE